MSANWFRHIRSLLGRTLLASLSLALSLLAVGMLEFSLAEPAFAQPEEETEQEERIAELIRQLNSDDYHEREEATHLLIQIGPPAIFALEQAENSPSPEVRYRASHILSIINKPPTPELLEAFVEGTLDENEAPLPGWSSLSDFLGDSTETRQLYVQMLDAEWNLLRAYQYSPNDFGEAFAARWKELGLEDPFRSTASEISLGSLSMLLFVSVDPQTDISEGTKNKVFFLCTGTEVFCSAVEASPHQEDLFKLLRCWVTEGNAREAKLQLAMRFKLEEGLISAERALSLEEFEPIYEGEAAHVQQAALLTLAMFGNEEEHGPLLEAFFADNTICPQYNKPPQYAYETQLRDIALACRIHLAGKDPKDFGFARLRPRSDMLFRTETLGFHDEASRSAAFALWEQAP